FTDIIQAADLLLARAHVPTRRSRRDPPRRTLARCEPATELRIVVDQTVQTHEGDPEIVGAVNLIRIWRVAEQHAESRIPGHCGFSYPIENAGGSEPQTTATVFACVTFLASLLRGGARVPTRCRSDAL